MAPRLSGQNSIFGVVFFVSKSLSFEKFAILTRKPRSHARILIYRTWPIVKRPIRPELYTVSGLEPGTARSRDERTNHEATADPTLPLDSINCFGSIAFEFAALTLTFQVMKTAHR